MHQHQQMALLQQQRAAQAARAQQQQQQQMAAMASGRGAAMPAGARQMSQEQRAMQAAALQQEYQRLVQEVRNCSKSAPYPTNSSTGQACVYFLMKVRNCMTRAAAMLSFRVLDAYACS